MGDFLADLLAAALDLRERDFFWSFLDTFELPLWSIMAPSALFGLFVVFPLTFTILNKLLILKP